MRGMLDEPAKMFSPKKKPRYISEEENRAALSDLNGENWNPTHKE